MSKEDDKHKRHWPLDHDSDEEDFIKPYDEFEDIRPVRDDWDNL